MVRPDARRSYPASEGLYNWRVSDFTIGDVIRKSRIARRWSQTKLGTEAASYQFGTGALPINKSTVSKVEKDPYWTPCTCGLDRRRCYPRRCLLQQQRDDVAGEVW